MSILLNHTQLGEGPELLILHGLFGSSSNWRTIAKALSSTFTVYCLDARNHGNSPWQDTMSYREMADDVAYFMDYHNIDAAHVLGHSMGGKTAMTLALNHPQRVDHLVVADISVRANVHRPEHERSIDAMQSLDLDSLSQGRKQAERYLTEKLNEPGAVIHFFLQNLVIRDNVASWRINLPVIKRSLKTIMDEVDTQESPIFSGPSLFLYGEKSDYIPRQDHESIKQIFPNAELYGIENAGHWLHAEQPAVFSDKVNKFLCRQVD